ncbi:universal stress protein A-like protein isoform X1 [Cryptomeria japonica]|uniref:universal stress protein A-like protein isoform X1 n=1 Tax=Cryptomeria japonica TaxID=3369 RepID=UPI0025AC8441|nr:universal stress protein A-like protein isoform X1 [Cryptomeria japonica]
MDIAEEQATKILIAVSRSSVKGYPHASLSSINAFHWTLDKLVKTSCSHLFKLYILHVQVPDEDGFDDMDSIYASPDDFKDVNDRDRIRGIHLLEYFVKHCNEIGVPCEARVKKGDAKEVICREVQNLHPDILVVGSRGLGPVQRIFVGTVSDYCAKHAECPVIVVKRKVEDTPEDPVDD